MLTPSNACENSTPTPHAPSNSETLHTPTSSPSSSSNSVKESVVTTHEENVYSEVVKLNQYTFDQFLGKGSYGSVYSAIDKNTQKVYAIKSLSKRRMQRMHLDQLLKSSRRSKKTPLRAPSQDISLTETSTPPQYSLIQKEIAILKRLNHPNCVKLYEVLDNVDGDEMYMVFELCPYGPIYKICPLTPCEPLPEETARNFFIQTLLGLEYLHEHHVIHRDIKPENLLLSPDHTVKIVDFGVSEYFTSSDQINTCAGSPYFLAPELIATRNTPLSGRAADVWALGVTLYAMIYGQFPFTGSSLVVLYDAIQNAPLSFYRPASEEVQDLLRHVLEKNPQQRLTLDEIRQHPWCAACAIPSSSANLLHRVNEEDLTHQDLDQAISNVQPIWNIIRFTTKLKRAVKRNKETEEGPATSDVPPDNVAAAPSAE